MTRLIRLASPSSVFPRIVNGVRYISRASVEKTILDQPTSRSILSYLKSLPQNDLKTYFSLDEQRNSDFTNKLLELINSEVISDPKQVLELVSYIKYNAFEFTRLQVSKDKDSAEIYRKIFDSIDGKFLEDPIKSSLAKFLLKPNTTKIQKPMFKMLVSEIINSPTYSDEDKLGMVFSYLDKLASIQETRIKLDLLNYFKSEYEKTKKVLKDKSMIEQKLLQDFQNQNFHSEFFREYCINLHYDFFNSLIDKRVVKPIDYPDLLIKLLNCNINLTAAHIDVNFKKFVRYLLSGSSQENSDLIAGFSWPVKLDSLEFNESFFETGNVRDPQVESFLITHQKAISEMYFESKLANLYPVNVFSKIIHRHAKEKQDMVNNVTSKLIKLVSKDQEKMSHNSKYLQAINNSTVEKDKNLKKLIEFLLQKFDNTIFSSSLNYNIRFLTSLFCALISYSMNRIDPASVMSILNKVVQLNQKLEVIRQRNKKEYIPNVNANLIILLLITGFRERGMTNESLKLLNYLINVNVENSNYEKERFRERSVTSKDLVTEFLMILRLNYSHDPRIFMSYYIELMTNHDSIMKTINGPSDGTKGNIVVSRQITNQELLTYSLQHPELAKFNNYKSSFYVLNKLGLIKLCYKKDSAAADNLEIDLKDSLQFKYYEENLVRANLRPELRNSLFTLESLSICYSVILEYLSSNELLTEKLLTKLYDNYIQLIEETQRIPNLSPNHPFSESKINDVITIQFINRCLSINKNVDLVDDFLIKFLNKVKFQKRKLSLKSFEKIIFLNAMKFFQDKSENREHYHNKTISWIKLMNNNFDQPLSFWSKMSLILLNYNKNKNRESYRWFMDLVEQGKNYDNLRHILLVNLARDNDWPLPKYLKNISVSKDVYFDKNDADPVLNNANFKIFNVTKDDILEFDNDKLEDFYDEDEGMVNGSASGHNSLGVLPAVNEKDSLQQGMDDAFFQEIYGILPKLTNN
ncbi:hypothetical protein DASC09_052560 [Saccharomycopsis crataegensis]|uniref:Uncharacterized protein n=1 Tax=Saccharomycopsis crataegensis TaxID=43959 RepID=A0AAV5QT94_9ASCO|nr:hypothetical protein DASC09_052560 [Saccharomycopsis crataegensis]